MRQLDIFDLDGTVAEFTADPAMTTIHPQFFDYATKTAHTVMVLTGREDKRVNPKATSLTCDLMLAPLLAKHPLDVISCHGLACVTKNGDVHLHPALERAQPAVQAAHDKMQEFEIRMANYGVIMEKKITGITVNINQVAKDRKESILAEAAALLAEFVNEESGLQLCPEHGSIELRPTVGKRDGFLYFVEQEIVPGKGMSPVFHCDSLGEHGTDRELADYMTNGSAMEIFGNNACKVVQVQHNKPPYRCASVRYATPGEHCEALVMNLQ